MQTCVSARNQEVQALQFKLDAERDYLRQMKILEAAETSTRAEEARKRMSTIQAEIKAIEEKLRAKAAEAGAFQAAQLQYPPPSGMVFDPATGKSRKATVSEAVFGAPAQNLIDQDNLRNELQGKQDEYGEAKNEYEKAADAAAKSAKEIDSLSGNIKIGGTNSYATSGGSGGGKEDFADTFRKELEDSTYGLTAYSQATARAEEKVAYFSAKSMILNISLV
jgi:hypothetical protein